MKYIRTADSRGKANFGWLDSKHSFSFGSYYDAEHMGVSNLRVINDDVVAPGQGFSTHGHQNMEIISYVINGALEHKDSTGNVYTVPAGEIQRMSAGKGIMHSEYNASKQDDVNFLQIWIQPNVVDIEPEYEQIKVPEGKGVTPLVNPNGEQGALRINADATIDRLQLDAGETHVLDNPGRVGYLHVVKGQLVADDVEFCAGDAFALSAEEATELAITADVEALWFNLPAA